MPMSSLVPSPVPAPPRGRASLRDARRRSAELEAAIAARPVARSAS